MCIDMLIDSDWCWLVLFDADRCWSMLIEADWGWLMLIEADWGWLMLVDADWCWLRLIDADWGSNKAQTGFLLSEHTSGASPVIFSISLLNVPQEFTLSSSISSINVFFTSWISVVWSCLSFKPCIRCLQNMWMNRLQSLEYGCRRTFRRVTWSFATKQGHQKPGLYFWNEGGHEMKWQLACEHCFSIILFFTLSEILQFYDWKQKT